MRLSPSPKDLSDGALSLAGETPHHTGLSKIHADYLPKNSIWMFIFSESNITECQENKFLQIYILLDFGMKNVASAELSA